MQINLGITSREGTADHREGNYSHLLSLLDPERGYDGVVTPKKVKAMNLITFHDLDDIEIQAPEYLNCIAPTETHIREIFKTFRHMQKENGEGILVHCEAGISRSTAGALLGLCVLGLSPQEAFSSVVAINELGLPNRRMLRIGGKMLGDNGALLSMAEAQRKYLFAKYYQKDPIETLKEQLQITGHWNLRWKCIVWLARNFGRSQRAGSDIKMISRLKTKLGMAEKAEWEKNKPTTGIQTKKKVVEQKGKPTPKPSKKGKVIKKPLKRPSKKQKETQHENNVPKEPTASDQTLPIPLLNNPNPISDRVHNYS